jgi:hypothetical protein
LAGGVAEDPRRFCFGDSKRVNAGMRMKRLKLSLDFLVDDGYEASRNLKIFPVIKTMTCYQLLQHEAQWKIYMNE